MLRPSCRCASTIQSRTHHDFSKKSRISGDVPVQRPFFSDGWTRLDQSTFGNQRVEISVCCRCRHKNFALALSASTLSHRLTRMWSPSNAFDEIRIQEDCLIIVGTLPDCPGMKAVLIEYVLRQRSLILCGRNRLLPCKEMLQESACLS